MTGWMVYKSVFYSNVYRTPSTASNGQVSIPSSTVLILLSYVCSKLFTLYEKQRLCCSMSASRNFELSLKLSCVLLIHWNKNICWDMIIVSFTIAGWATIIATMRCFYFRVNWIAAASSSMTISISSNIFSPFFVS